MTTAAQPAPDALPVGIERLIYEGYRVLPVKRGQKFPPLIDDWPHAASFDLQIVDGWSRQWAACNWAVCCGAESGVWILDIDGDTGLGTVADWENRGLALPATRTVLTSKGGRQLHFKYPEGLEIRPSVRKLGAGLDVRGAASYGMLPPSIHPSGWRYQFADDDRNPVLAAPEWLLAKLAEASKAEAQHTPTIGAEATKGHRTALLVSLAGTMVRRGMTPLAIEAALLAENAARCNPPLPEGKVRQIAADIHARYPAGHTEQPDAPALVLQPLGDLLRAPSVPLDYVWSGRLVAGTVSLLVSKPKVGKSTLARNLCLSVATGVSCLGWQCKQGTVIYVALEERVADVVADFRSLGAEPSDPIFVCDDSRISTALLCELVREKRPALVVIDPLQRLTRVKDGQSYAENYNALGPLIDVARESGSHLMLCHHSAKVDRGDSIDSPLGSTALAGAVSTVLRMKRTDNFRSLCSVQRRGPDLAEVTLTFDPQTKRLACGELRETFELENLGKLILAALKDAPMSEPDILDGIEAGAKLKRRELRKLVSEGKIQRTGTGKKGDPYIYQKILVCSSNPTEKMPDENLYEGNMQEQSVKGKNARLAPITCNGTRKRESSDTPEPYANSEKMLVPSFFQNDENPASAGRAFSASETGEIELEF